MLAVDPQKATGTKSSPTLASTGLASVLCLEKERYEQKYYTTRGQHLGRQHRVRRTHNQTHKDTKED